MPLPLFMSIWPPGPLVTAGRQVQGQARGERTAGSRTRLGTEAWDPGAEIASGEATGR